MVGGILQPLAQGPDPAGLSLKLCLKPALLLEGVRTSARRAQVRSSDGPWAEPALLWAVNPLKPGELPSHNRLPILCRVSSTIPSACPKTCSKGPEDNRLSLQELHQPCWVHILTSPLPLGRVSGERWATRCRLGASQASHPIEVILTMMLELLAAKYCK